MPKREITAKETIQEILERMNIDVTTDPEELEHFYTSNIFSRVFAYLVAKIRANEYVTLRATPS